MKVDFEIKGLAALSKKLRQIGGDAAVKAVGDEVKLGAEMIRSTAIQSISRVTSQGRQYKGHTASKPGDPPNTDTGRLVQSIQVQFSKLSAKVGTNVVYGKYLEYGTSKVEARPWLVPALRANAKQISDAISAKINEVMKK